jgi:hypothetical protein
VEEIVGVREPWEVRSLPRAPGGRQRRVHRYSAATQEEHADKSPGAMKAEGPSGDHPQLVVEPLHETVGELGFDVYSERSQIEGISLSHGRREQGAKVPEYCQYFKPEQRSCRRSGPAKNLNL